MALSWIYSVVKVKPSMRQFSTVCLQLPGFILPSQQLLKFSKMAGLHKSLQVWG